MSSIDLSILSKSDWQNYYPKENYKKETNGRHGITHYFHYFMNLQKDATVIAQIKKAGIHVLTQSDSKVFKLTPLAIACMQGRAPIVEALLKRFAEEPGAKVKIVEWLNTRDSFGWTPLHHASLTSEVIFNELCEIGADVNVKTGLGATCDDLRRYTRLGDCTLAKSVVKIEDETGRLLPLNEISPDYLKELTGLESYRDEPYFPPAYLKDLWMQEITDDYYLQPCMDYVIAQFEQVKKNPIRLIIGKNKELSSLGIKGYELRADQKIRKGQIIAEYGMSYGYVSPVDEWTKITDYFNAPQDPYAFTNTTALHHGNAMRFANNAFPNTFMVSATIGGTLRYLFVASDNLDPGTALHWDYGLKSENAWGTCFPLNKEKMVNYYQYEFDAFRKTFPVLAQKFESGNACWEDSVEFAKANGISAFPSNNPNMMLFFHFKKIINIKDIDRCLMDNDHMIYGQFVFLSHAVLQRVVELEEAIKTYTKREKDLVNATFLDGIGKLKLSALVKLAVLIKEHVPAPITKQYLNDTVEQLKEYDENCDPDFPISLSYMVNTTVGFFDEWMVKNDLNPVSLLATTYCTQKAFSSLPKTPFYQVISNVVRQQEQKYPEFVLKAKQRFSEIA